MTFAEIQADAVRLLEQWAAPEPEQDARRLDYLGQLAEHADAVSRDGVPDHLTSGGFVFDPTLEKVALVLHSKARLWLQPGGHFEEHDHGVVDAALREIREETGLPVRAAGARIVDLHHHELSAAFGRCRSHRDVRVSVVLDEPAEIVCSDESEQAAWWSVDALPTPTDPDLPETIKRVRNLLLADRSVGTREHRRADHRAGAAAAPTQN